MIFPVLRHQETFQGLLCSMVGISTRSVLDGTQDPEEDKRMLQQSLHDEPTSTLDFWKSLVYGSEGVTDEHKALVPPLPLLEYYHDGIPATMAQKSFLFTCVVGLGPLLLHGISYDKKLSVLRFVSPPNPPPNIPIFQSSTFGYLAAWHLLHLLDHKSVSLEGPLVLNSLNMEDRLQYLRESEHHQAAEQLERSRWLHLDAGKEATYLSLQQLQTTILVDMSMLLLWYRSPSVSEQNQAPNLIICLAMIFLAMDGRRENDCRITYFLIQQAFQSIRCRNLQTFWKHASLSTSACALATECAEDIQRGWSRFTRLWKPQSLPSPAGARFFCNHNLLKSGLWPILLNPFKLSGRKWADVGHQSPFNGLKAHCALKEAVFTLDPELLTGSINTEEAAAPYEDRIAALKMYVTEGFSKMSSPHEGVFLKSGEDPSVVGVPKAVVLARAAGLGRWLNREEPGDLLHDVTWPSSDPHKTGLRCKLALDAATDLSSSGDCRDDQRDLNQFLDKLQFKEPNWLCSLARWCPSCNCNARCPDKEVRSATLRTISPFCTLMPRNPHGYDPDEMPLNYRAPRKAAAILPTKHTRKNVGIRRKYRTRLGLGMSPPRTEDPRYESEYPRCEKPPVAAAGVMTGQPIAGESHQPLLLGSISVSILSRDLVRSCTQQMAQRLRLH